MSPFSNIYFFFEFFFFSHDISLAPVYPRNHATWSPAPPSNRPAHCFPCLLLALDASGLFDQKKKHFAAPPIHFRTTPNSYNMEKKKPKPGDNDLHCG